MNRNFAYIQRTCLSIALLVGWAFAAQAQRYDFEVSMGSFTPLVGGTVVEDIQADDAFSTTLPIGFTFKYFGADYTEFRASSNGLITFDLEIDLTSNGIINNEFRSATKIIAPLWDDVKGDAGIASYKVSGASPNRILTFEWLNWKWNFNGSDPSISFQLKLYETSNKIEFVYRAEAGDLESPSASIGFANSSGQFYSLTSSSSTATLSLASFNDIDSKPATGQTFTFTPNSTPHAPPTIQASNVTVSSYTNNNPTFNWTNGNGQFRAVFIKPTSDDLNAAPVNGSGYNGSTTFGGGDEEGSGWFCVYNGTGSSVLVYGLSDRASYRVHVVEYNGIGGAQQYIRTAATNNPLQFTHYRAPQPPVSTINLLARSASQVTFAVAKGDGEKRVIFIKAGSGTSAPADATTYTASTTFGSGTQIGTSGWFCVFNGEEPTGEITVNGLSPNTAYSIHAVDYNGTAGWERYFVANVDRNPVQFTSFDAVPVPTYTFAATAGTFTPLAGGNAVDVIETDDGLSSTIPLGFTFYLGGIAFTNARASSNGILSFNEFGNNLGRFNDLLSSAARPLVAPLWDDLKGDAGQASYLTTGTAPNRIFTFEWLNWKWRYGATAPVISFQAKLYEGNNKVEYIYRQEAGALDFPDASIGLAFAELGSGNIISLNNTTASPTTSTTTETANIGVRPATGQVYSFTPRHPQTITFGPLAEKTFGGADFVLTGTASSGLSVTYASSNPAVATISGNTVWIGRAGTATITASQAGDANFSPAANVEQILTVRKADQFNAYLTAMNRNFGDTAFDLPARSDFYLRGTRYGFPFSYSSSNPSVATVTGNTVTIVGVGTTTITASQAGDDNFNPAPTSEATLTVNKGYQAITFGALAAKSVGDAAFDLTGTASSSLPISYSSSNSAVATATGSTITIVGAGTTTITASQAGNANFNAAANVQQTLTVNKGSQTITFGALAAKSVGDAAFDLTATATSSLPISYSSGNTSVATVTGSTITIVGAGTTTITASQAGNANFNAAANVQQTLTVNKGSQTITFGALAAKSVGDAPFDLTATASSSLPISYSSSNTSVATVSGSTVTIVAVGTTTITASQAGNANFNAAQDVAQTLTVKSSQTITFSPIADKAVGDAAFTLTATASSNLPVTFSTTSTGKITINGSQVTIVGGGRATITAAQGGNSDFGPAPSVEQSFCIKPAKPTITLSGANTASPTLTSNAATGNQWFLDGTAIPGATNPTVSVTKEGVYKVQVKIDNCTSDFSSDQSMIVTAVEPGSGEGISLYPNPVADELTIDLRGFEKNKTVSIATVDLLGRTINQLIGAGGSEVKMDVRSLPSGLYIVKLRQGKNSTTKSFIKSAN